MPASNALGASGPSAPNAPVWMPAQAPPPSSMAMNPHMMAMLSYWLRVIGFVVLFVGTAVIAAFATPGGGCFGPGAAGCGANTSFASGAANAILTGRILWSIGLLLLGGGAGIKLHYVLQNPTTGRSDDVQYVMADRRANGLLLLVSIGLLFLTAFWH